MKRFVAIVLIAGFSGVLVAFGAEAWSGGNTQLLSSDAPRFPSLKDSVFYEIFVQSFQDSDGDGFGDIKGIISRLDYLNSGIKDDPNSLGVNGIWMWPIFPALSPGHYNAVDHYSIDPKYGTLEDFKTLVREAHRRGIRIMLDMAFTVTSDQHPWFQEALSNSSSPKHDWYIFKSHDPLWPGYDYWQKSGNEYYYCFYGPTMPQLNLKNPAVVAEVKNILSYWSSLGADGFRLDSSALYIPSPGGERRNTLETHLFTREIIQSTKEHSNSNAFFVGENWSPPSVLGTYLNNRKEEDLDYDFPVSRALQQSLVTETGQPIEKALRAELQSIDSPTYLARMTSDRFPIATSAGGDPRKMRVAAALPFTLPGTPFIFYGEEIGRQSDPPPPFPHPKGFQPRSSSWLLADRQKRIVAYSGPMMWDDSHNHGFTLPGSKPWAPFAEKGPEGSVEAELTKSGSLLHFYQKLVRLRKKEPILREGNLVIVRNSDPAIVTFLRTTKEGEILILLNFSKRTVPNFTVELPDRRRFDQTAIRPILGTITPRVQVDSGAVSFLFDHIQPLAVSFIKITR